MHNDEKDSTQNIDVVSDISFFNTGRENFGGIAQRSIGPLTIEVLNVFYIRTYKSVCIHRNFSKLVYVV